MKIFYSPKYHEKITHLSEIGKTEYFLDTVIKPQWVYESSKDCADFEFINPENKVNEDDLLRVHSREYLMSLRSSTPIDLATSSGLRWVPQLYGATLSSVNGYYSSVIHAITENVSGSLSTNFHHATKNHGSGFCVLNGFAIAGQKLIAEKKASRVMILDCDYHYGDGNAEILKDNEQFLIFDIYGGFHSQQTKMAQKSNIISYQVKSAEEYFSKLIALKDIIDNFKPDIVMYDAGMDVWENSRIGKIEGMNTENIRKRESFVFQTCKEKGVPIAFLIGGGYVNYKNKIGELLQESDIEKNKKDLAKIHRITLEEGYKAI